MITRIVALLLCLALQRFFELERFKSERWFKIYLGLISRGICKVNTPLAYVMIILPIWLLFLTLHLLFTWSLSGLFDVLLTTLVLLFTIDSRDLSTTLQPYFNAVENQAWDQAATTVANFVDSPISSKTTSELEHAVTRAILIRSFEQLFAGLFWFIIFGIYGASAYLLVRLIKQQTVALGSEYMKLAESSAKLQDLLEWAPSRLVGISFALVGRFSRTANYCTQCLWLGPTSVKSYVVEAARAAIDLELPAGVHLEENRAALDLINRVIIVWIVAITFILIGVMI